MYCEYEHGYILPWHFSSFRSAAHSVAAPAVDDVATRYGSARMSAKMTSHFIHLPVCRVICLKVRSHQPTRLRQTKVESLRKPVYWWALLRLYQTNVRLIWSVFRPLVGFRTFQNQLDQVEPSRVASLGENVLTNTTKRLGLQVAR